MGSALQAQNIQEDNSHLAEREVTRMLDIKNSMK